MIKMLEDVGYLTVYNTQANFVMCKVDKINVDELCYDLLEDNIFVKNLTHKINNGMQYIRLAIRTDDDNDKLIKALKNVDVR